MRISPSVSSSCSPKSIRTLYLPEEQAEMHLALEDIHNEVEKNVWRYGSLRTFMTYEKIMLSHPNSTAESEMLSNETEASEEGYFYYKEMEAREEVYFFYRNFAAGVRKCAHTMHVDDNDATARYIVNNFGKDGMLKWIKHGFK